MNDELQELDNRQWWRLAVELKIKIQPPRLWIASRLPTLVALHARSPTSRKVWALVLVGAMDF